MIYIYLLIDLGSGQYLRDFAVFKGDFISEDVFNYKPQYIV